MLTGLQHRKGIPGAVYTFQSKSWMEEQLGIEWFEQIFLPNCSDHRPQLLILDSHCSHEVLSVLEMAKENNIHILALPPHCTHALQPLDRCIFGPVNKAYNNAYSQFTSDNPGKVVDKKMCFLNYTSKHTMQALQQVTSRVVSDLVAYILSTVMLYQIL